MAHVHLPMQNKQTKQMNGCGKHLGSTRFGIKAMSVAGLKGAAVSIFSNSLEEEHLKVKLATC